MKILWLSQFVPFPPKIGAIHRSYNLLREISGDHDVSLVAFNQPALMSTLFQGERDGLQIAIRELEKICLEVLVCDLPEKTHFFGKNGLAATSLLSRRSFTELWLESVEYRQLLVDLVRENDFDIIHMDTISFSSYKDVFDGAMIMNHHNVESHLLIRRSLGVINPFMRWFLRHEGRKLRRLELETAGQFDAHLFCSELDKKRFGNRENLRRARVIENGVAVNAIPAYTDHDEPRLVFLGTLSWLPNAQAVEWIVNQIWPLIRDDVDSVVFELVGAGAPKSAEKLALQDGRFRVRGFVDEIADYINPNNIFICPINDGGGTKLKILDAFERGMPVVAHPIAMEGIDARPGLDYLAATSAQDFLCCVKQLLSDKDFREKLGANAREMVVKSYSYRAIAKKLVNEYSSVLNQREGEKR